MNVQLLIDAIVRQTTVLIAELATSGGLRAPLAHVANQVFLDLASELERQGVSRKVSADMFGLALRGYQRKIQRLTESSTARGHSLWEAVLEFVSGKQFATRTQILMRFSRDDEGLVRGVLHDLTESGLLFCSGAGAGAGYRATTIDELGEIRAELGAEGLDEIVWLLVFREGPFTTTALQQRMNLTPEVSARVVQRLLESGRLRENVTDGEASYSSAEFYIPLGASVGWTAAVLDHFQAVARTISAKLRSGSSGQAADVTGGSTYTFVVWPGHPQEAEVRDELRRYREWASRMRATIDSYNREHGIPEHHFEVTSYAGQCVLEYESRESEDDNA
jgi:hypothetical protein